MYLARTLRTIMIIWRWILRMRKVAAKFVEGIKTHVMPGFFFQKIVPFMRWFGKMWYSHKTIDDNIIRRVRTAYWITKATDTHSEYLIFIYVPKQQWLLESASILRLYVHGLSCLFSVTARLLTSEYRVILLKGCIPFCFIYYIYHIPFPSCAKLWVLKSSFVCDKALFLVFEAASS